MKSRKESLPCLTLWRRVLLEVVSDLSDVSAHPAVVRGAELWVGKRISRDFRDVCQLAGVDPVRTHAALSALIPLSPRERKAEVRARRHAVPELRDAA